MIRRQQAIDEPLALIPFVGAESSQILQFMIILSKTVVHIVYVMKQGRHISMDAWTETEGTKRHKNTSCIISCYQSVQLGPYIECVVVLRLISKVLLKVILKEINVTLL